MCPTILNKYVAPTNQNITNERKNQVILLMITAGKKWHYLALKSEPIFYNGKLCNRPVYLDYL